MAACALPLMGAAPGDWRIPDPENTLVIETTRGMIVVELYPQFAPQGVERVKRLAREGVYDGLEFHRVIEGFVDQTGNPNNKDGGTSAYPDLPAEFTFAIPADAMSLAVERSDGREGFVGAAPVAAVSRAEEALRTDGRVRAWGAYCAGVMGLGRQADPGSANSEFFFMRAPARRLDHDYAVVGHALQGLEVIRAIKVGEPPADPDRMLRVRLAADLEPQVRPALQVMDTASAAFRARLARVKRARGAAFTVCDVEIPVRSARP